MKREAWFDLARDLDWDFSYVREEEVFPSEVSGTPWLAAADWKGWDEPCKTTYADYVANQSEKERALGAVRAVLGQVVERLIADLTPVAEAASGSRPNSRS